VLTEPAIGKSVAVRLQDRVIIVTGAAGGIGAAIVDRLTSEGAAIHAVDVALDAPGEVSDQNPTTTWASSTVCDIADPKQCDAAVTDALDRHGRLDGLVNCAGVGVMRRTEDHEFEEWRRILAVNLDGTFSMCRAAIGALLEQRGSIVNIASVAGLRGQPYNAAYCASKGGVISLSEALAIEYQRRGVRVNCIAPGGVATTFASKMGFSGDLDWDHMAATVMRITDAIEPDEIAGGVAYLLSDDARSITGQTLVIDKGLLKM
jgi:NAD(P)-dependent dehydrogenase (short-subunit alcohol dehydrogenase family)